MLRALELSDYRAPKRRQPSWLAKRLGIPREEGETCLRALATARQIKLEGRLWVIDRTKTIDTRVHPARGRRLKAEWLKVALERLQAGVSGVFGYNLMAISRVNKSSDHALELEELVRPSRQRPARSWPCARPPT